MLIVCKEKYLDIISGTRNSYIVIYLIETEAVLQKKFGHCTND